MKIIVAGDFCDKFRVTDIIARKEYDALFGKVRNIVKSADYSFVNFEFPIVKNEGKPIPKCGPNLMGQPEAVEAIQYAGFQCCTLANNHILDQGEECLIDTKKRIERAGISTVGAGADLSDAAKILYIEKDEKRIAVINCCEHEFSIATETTGGANPLNPILQYYSIQEARQKVDYVLVIVHGGHELYQLPSPRMKETYRFFIDAGADAVINHHQHCYSGYEVYRGKPIFYGLGNFLFDKDGERNSIWNEGYMVELIFDENISFKMIPYVQCAEKPAVEPMVGDKVKDFESYISKLNAIICDDEKLKEEHYKWMTRSSNYYMLALEPYQGKVMSALYMRKMLPSFINRKKSLQILNYIQCEAHLDRLRFGLKEILNK